MYRAIVAAPSDDLHRLVAADWLEETQHPACVNYAHFIRLQIEQANGKGDLDEAISSYWSGYAGSSTIGSGPDPDAAVMAVRAGLGNLSDAIDYGLDIRFQPGWQIRRGFVEAVFMRMAAADESDVRRLFECQPVRYVVPNVIPERFGGGVNTEWSPFIGYGYAWHRASSDRENRRGRQGTIPSFYYRLLTFGMANGQAMRCYRSGRLASYDLSNAIVRHLRQRFNLPLHPEVEAAADRFSPSPWRTHANPATSDEPSLADPFYQGFLNALDGKPYDFCGTERM